MGTSDNHILHAPVTGSEDGGKDGGATVDIVPKIERGQGLPDNTAPISGRHGPVVDGPDGPMCPIAARKARRRRRLKWHLSIWTVLLAVGAVLFAIMLSMSLTGRVVTLPDWLTRQVETVINQQTDKADLSLHRLEFGFSPKGIPRLRMVDVGIKDQTGLEVARLNAVEGGMHLGDVLRGEIKPAWLRLHGAQVTLRRRANGEFDLSFGAGGGATGDLATILDVIDSEFSSGKLSGLEDITTEALTITLEDARSGRLWQVTDGRLKVTHNDEAVDISVAFDVFNQTEELAETILGFRAFKGRTGATMTATFKNALAQDIAAQSPVMAFLSVVDAPISGALHTVINDAGGIEDLAGTLEFGEGAITPGEGVAPIRFDGGKVYMDYDPERERIDFAEISVLSDWGEAQIDGHAYLRGWDRGWPAELIGQLALSSARISPPDLFEGPVDLAGGQADFRLRLDPFELDLGALSVSYDDGMNPVTATGRGRAAVRNQSWDLALDLTAKKVTPEQVVTFWPIREKSLKSRTWTKENVHSGYLEDVSASVRVKPGQKPVVAVSSDFKDLKATVVRDMVPVEEASGRLYIENNQLIVAADKGVVRPEGHEAIDIAGTRFVVLDMKTKPAPARVDLNLRGAVPAALDVLSKPPFRIFKHSKTLGPDVVSGGRFALTGPIHLVLKRKLRPQEAEYDLNATLRDVVSDRLIPEEVLRLQSGELSARNDAIILTGQGRLGKAPLSTKWVMPLDPETGRGQASRVTGDLPLDQRLLDELQIELPKGTLSGRGTLSYEITLAPDRPPRLTARSDLRGVGLAISALGWSKPSASKGDLRLEAVLSKPAAIPSFEIKAPGFSAVGQMRFNAQKELEAAEFSEVSLGGWLEAPVTLVGRGKGVPPAISVRGGTLDMRKATLGGGKGGGSVQGAVPIDLQLDHLIVSNGIVLTGFAGDFTQHNGTTGTFKARVANGPAISGVVAPQAKGTAIRITSANAGGVMKAAGVFKSAVGGKMNLVLAPGGAKGNYDGEVKISDISVREAPAMAELLSAISVVGLLQQLGGQGIQFNEVEGRFRLDPEKVSVYRSSAVGPSMGISMDGYYHLGSSRMEMQGVVSPFYFVNSVGRVMARKGEGLVGFNYSLEGTPDQPNVNVNLLSLFTPGIFRDIFRRKPPPKPSQPN